MSDHAKYSPSGAHRWTRCPGSVALAATLPESSPSIYAAEGTLAHELASNFLAGKALPQLHSKIKREGFEFNIDVEFLEAMNYYVRFVQAKKHKLKLRNKSFVEKQVKLKNKLTDLFGTVDFIAIKDNRIIVTDYKHGSGITVEAKQNMQLALYALMVMDTFKIKPSSDLWLELNIVQPRAYHPDNTKVRKWIVNSAKVYRPWKIKFLKAIKRCENEKETYIIGGHCKFCDCIPVCPALEKEALTLALSDFDEIPLLDPDKIKHILSKSQQIKDYLREIDIQALSLLRTGQEIPGYKLVRRKSNRIWKDEPWLEKYLFRNGYMPYEIYNQKLKSPNQLTPIVGKDLIDYYSEKKSSGTTIAPKSDRRKEVKGDFDE